MSGSDENSSNPEKSINTSPPSVQSQVSLASCAGLSRRIPIPSREKSTRAMVPIDSANPTIWKHSRIGNASAEEFSGFVISMYTGQRLDVGGVVRSVSLSEEVRKHRLDQVT